MENKTAKYLCYQQGGPGSFDIIIYCSRCSSKVERSEAERNNFCPICGSKITYKQFTLSGGGASSGYGVDLSWLEKIQQNSPYGVYQYWCNPMIYWRPHQQPKIENFIEGGGSGTA